MGLSCKITETENGTQVIAPNGQQSKLYEDAKAVSSKPLNVWATAYLPEFKEENGEWEKGESLLELDSNGEPLLRQVAGFIESMAVRDKKLSTKETEEILNNLQGLDMTLEEFVDNLNTTFMTSGIFSMDKLDKSILYSSAEKLNIRNNTSIQDNIRKLITKLNNTDLSEVTTEESSDLLLQNPSELIGIGKYRNINEYELIRELAPKLAGIKNREEFDSKIIEIQYESIVERYLTDSDFANREFNRFSIMKGIPVLNEANQQDSTSTEVTMTETLKTQESDLDLEVTFLNRVSESIWEDNASEIKRILAKIEKKAVELNIDLVGLVDSYLVKSRTEILGLLNKVADFTKGLERGLVNTNDISQLATLLDNYFGRTQEAKVEYKTVPRLDSNKTLFEVTSPLSEIEMYRQHSLVRTNSKYYQKVKKETNLKEMYERFYDYVLGKPEALNERAFYPVAFNTKDEFVVEKLLDITNKAEVMNSLKKFVKTKMGQQPHTLEQEALEELTIFKLVFRNPIKTKTDLTKVNEITGYTGRTKYLKTDFIADFQTQVLREKQKNSSLYNNALKYFSITTRGIDVVDDLKTKETIKRLLPKKLKENLSNYAVVSKNSRLADFTTPSDKMTVEAFRIYHSNNSDSLEEFRDDYEVIDGTLFTRVDKLFLRTKEGLFERVREQQGVVAYNRIQQNNENFYVMQVQEPSTEVDFSDTRFMRPIDTTNKVKKHYNKKEEDSIQDQIADCG